ncbi:MAG: DUF2800 domain-containing protein [Oscillospiraceae bacterium]|nr:DUF2800 domain-containing protein [Oscillospiraceae bacterium]
MAPQNHALLAPSASSRWLRCPASVIWTSRAPRGESSAFAQEGTWAHALAERYLRAGIDGTPDDEVRFTDEEVTAIVAAGLDPDDFRGPVMEYVNYVRSIPGMLLVEQELDLEPITGEKGAKGTSDAVVIDEAGEIHICDLKYGRGEQVEADHNTQLAIYAGAAIAAFSFMADIKIVNLHIVQPRLSHTVVWTAPLDVFEPFLEDIRKGAAKALRLFETVGDGTPAECNYHPGPVACRWCCFRGQCGALAGYALTSAGLELPDSIKPKIDGEALADLLSRVDLIQSWLKDLGATAHDALLAGEKIPGYKLVEGRAGPRKWSDESKAEKMLKGWKVPAEARYVKSLISPTAAEKLVKMKTLTDEQWGELNALISREPGKLTVVPESDKRPAVTGKPDAEAYPDESKPSEN